MTIGRGFLAGPVRVAVLAAACLLTATSVQSQSRVPGQGNPTPGLPAHQHALLEDASGQTGHAVRSVSSDRIEADIRRLTAFGTRHTLSPARTPDRGIDAAAEWVKAQFDSVSLAWGDRLLVSYDEWDQAPGRRVPQAVVLRNVVAVLPGTGPGADRILLVGGHLDSRASDVMDAMIDAPGANDDASGVAVALELARVMTPFRWEATLVFVAFTGEEQGLLGSTHWAETAAANGLTVQAMITNDIVGNTRGADGQVRDHYVRVFSEGISSAETPEQARSRAAVGGENDSASRQWARYVRDAAATHVPGFEARLVARRDRYLRGGDHIPFNRLGWAGVRFTEPAEDYTHQHQDVRTEDGVTYGDLPEFVDFEYVARVARVNAAALGEASQAPAPPKDVVIDVSRLTGDTTLRWAQNTEPDLDGYRVVWRETTEPLWTGSRDVGIITEVTLPLSKDDVIFGLQARDRNGHLSPAVVPIPER